MKKLKKYFGVLDKSEWLIAVSLFVILFTVVTASRLLRLNSTHAIESKDAEVIILNQSADLPELINKFRSKGISFDATELHWAANILGWKSFRPGRYEVNGSYSYDILLSRMARGIQDPLTVTILPGLTKDKFVNTVSQNLKMNASQLNEVFNDSLLWAQEGLSTRNLIGRMLPDSYLVYWDIKPRNFIKRILSEFDKRVAEKHRERIDELRYSLDELITLASIVEWEAKADSEKAKIAGLYWNRLDKGMRLQADPTVNYAVGKRRRLLLEDYKYKHPYNTYLIKGLPPGPITNPSYSSIKATLYPAEHDYLFMVASPDDSKSHEFNTSYSDHLKATEKWRRWLRKQYRIKKQREAKQSAS